MFRLLSPQSKYKCGFLLLGFLFLFLFLKIVLHSGPGWFQVQGSTTAATWAVGLELMKQAQEYGSVLVAWRSSWLACPVLRAVLVYGFVCGVAPIGSLNVDDLSQARNAQLVRLHCKRLARGPWCQACQVDALRRGSQQPIIRQLVLPPARPEVLLPHLTPI